MGATALPPFTVLGVRALAKLLTADIHLSDNPRDSYRWGFQKWLRSTVKRLNISSVYILGDLTERNDMHSAWLVNRLVGDIALLAELCDVTILPGNHDGRSPDNPFFAFTNNLRHVTWIGTPTRFGDELFLPHTNNYERDWQQSIANGDFTATTHYYHQTFAGSVGEGGFQLEGIPLTVIPKGTRAFSGDVHTPQTNGPLTYVGAPYRVDFGDDFDPRVIILDGAKVTSLPVPGPQKRLIKLASISKLAAHLANKGDIVKITVALKSEEFAEWQRYRGMIEDLAYKEGWALHSASPIITHTLSHKLTSESKQKPDAEIMRAFAARQGLNDKLLNVGMEFLPGGKNK